MKADRTRVALEISAVPLKNGDRIVGVFGQFVSELKETPGRHTQASRRGRPRCSDCSSKDARPADRRRAALTTTTVRNHVRNVLRTLGAHSRIEA